MVADLLAEASQWTWRFLRDAPFRPREETITELLLTDFARCGGGAVQVHKASIKEEVDSGLDWAWALQTAGGWVHMLIQAKQIRGSRWGWYEELRKEEALVQTGNLIDAGAYFNAVPAFALYNSEVAPFGPKGTSVPLGGCGRTTIERDSADKGLPWDKGSSPLGVTIAHAEDIQSLVLGPPHTRQRAANVNTVAMPWECIVCPKSVSGGIAPRIWGVAETIRQFAGGAVEASEVGAAWFTEGPPGWADFLVEGLDPTEAEDAPPAHYFVRTASDGPRPSDGDRALTSG